MLSLSNSNPVSWVYCVTGGVKIAQVGFCGTAVQRPANICQKTAASNLFNTSA